MQIEEIIGGINGDTSAQAIQLRMRSTGQGLVSSARLKAYDSQGLNPVLLLDIASNVSNNASGANILLSTAAFNLTMSGVAGYSSDFTLLNAIPASYLNGGKVTFESDAGAILWSVAFGSYTGTNTGSTSNDSDGNFGLPTSAVPTATRQALRFTGTATAASTTNVADYALSADPATVRGDAGVRERLGASAWPLAWTRPTRPASIHCLQRPPVRARRRPRQPCVNCG